MTVLMSPKTIKSQINKVSDYLQSNNAETVLSHECLNLLRTFESNTFNKEETFSAIFNLTITHPDPKLQHDLLSIFYDIIQFQNEYSLRSDSVDWEEFIKINCH